MRSIKTKLITYFSVLIVLISIILGSVSYYLSSQAIQDEAEQALEAIAYEGSRLTESRIETQLLTLEMIANRADIERMNAAEQALTLRRQIGNTSFLALAVVHPNGTAYYEDGTTADLGDRDYVQRAFDGESNVSNLIISRVTNEPVLMYAVPIENNGRVIGVLIGRRDGNALSQITDEIHYGEHGYAYMINGDGTVIAHHDREMVLNEFNPIEEAKNDDSQKSVASLFTTMLEEHNGVNSYSYDGNNLYAGFAQIPGTDWKIIITAVEDEVLGALPGLQRALFIITLIVLAISIIVSFVIGNSITKPIILTINHSEKIANLDLSEDVNESFLERKDEIGQLSKAMQTIVTSLRNIIHDVAHSSDQVAASSEELSATSQQSAAAATEVAKTVEEIANGASEQARSTEEGSQKAYLLGETVENNQEYLQSLNSASEKVGIVAKEGLTEIETLTSIIAESSEAARHVYEGILKTNQSSQSIGEASSVIANIADQTNLLALNAAIEAARAGEAGKGFAVVADEIRKLAEQSTMSTKTIDEVVQQLQTNSKQAVETMESVGAIIEQQNQSVQQNREKYLQITDAIKVSEDAVEKLNTSGDEMNKMKEEILNALQGLSAIAEENSASTEEVSASIEEQTASMEEISKNSEGLAELSQNLQSTISKFKV